MSYARIANHLLTWYNTETGRYCAARRKKGTLCRGLVIDVKYIAKFMGSACTILMHVQEADPPKTLHWE